jgi:hypothetical protein
MYANKTITILLKRHSKWSLTDYLNWIKNIWSPLIQQQKTSSKASQKAATK